MAQLKQAEDGHFYILGGPNKGTWQIHEKGLQWLRLNGYRMPNQENSTSLDRGVYRSLKDKDYLFKYNIAYDRTNNPEPTEDMVDPAPPGLPLFLQLGKQAFSTWTLKIELSELRNDPSAWAELQRYHADSVTVNAAITPAIAQRQLLNIPCLLDVRPETQPYLLQREDVYHARHPLQHTPVTQGLSTNYQGNVFVENKQKFGQKSYLWHRCLPNSTLSFTGTILWLAKIECQHEWPGNAQRVGSPHMEWQLWQLDISDSSTITWDEIEKWFSYRAIDIVHQHQQIQLITPSKFVTDDGWFTCLPSTPLLIQCSPPRRVIGGITQQSSLSAVAFQSNAFQLDWSSQTNSVPLLVDRTSFLSWQPTLPGQYHIRLNGDTTAEPLLIRINSTTTTLPQWLHGIRCSITSGYTQQTFCAFQDSLTTDQHAVRNILDQFTQDELATLLWTSEPEGLLIRVTWEYGTEQGTQYSDSPYFIRSSRELTTCWQERIWPSIAESTKASILLDAGSFGFIELSLIPTTTPENAKPWWSNERLCTQFVWLSNVAQDRNTKPQTTMPAPLRQALRQHCEQTQHLPVLCRALQRIASTDTMSSWILIRLQTLLKDVEQ